MKVTNVCTKIIEYSFYSLIIIVPLVFAGNTSELFEFNKMWWTFGLTIVVATAWASKMVVEKRFYLQRTPLDIPITLFLISQIISTLISLDQHVSWWGYYSRFNGGLASIISYIVLYYAFVSNLQIKHVYRTLKLTLFAGFLTALWGFPAHFGYDPTCLMFRGTFDTSCWTDAFRPTIRTFSTLGQPAWFAAYLALLIPLSISYGLTHFRTQVTVIKKPLIQKLFSNWTWHYAAYLTIAGFFYVNLIFANTRAGFIAFWVANIIYWSIIFLKHFFRKKHFLYNFVAFNAIFLILTFIFSTPIAQLNKFTLTNLKSVTSQPAPVPEETFTGAPAVPGNSVTDSGDIRLLVWSGAIDTWKSSPIFGTGVESYAFAYYKYKPAAHNLTSEWDYLYNKAHNEYLNYLATTGIFGLGSYVFFILLFAFLSLNYLFPHFIKQLKTLKFSALRKDSEEGKNEEMWLRNVLTVGLVTGWITILITNFFGFSVVIMNLYLFLIPLFVFILMNIIQKYPFRVFPAEVTEQAAHQNSKNVSAIGWTTITVFVVIAGWMIVDLLYYHQADVAYALGSNLNKIGNYQQAYPELTKAVEIKPNEPVYKDELSINLAAISAGLYAQKDTANAQKLAEGAIQLSDGITQSHPNNVVYWKNRVRLFYTLSATDTEHQGQYLTEALNAISKARELAPNDAKIAYNQGVLLGQTGNLDKAIEVLNKAKELKPNYTDVYIALGLFYHEQSVNEEGAVVNKEKNQKAIETYEFILENLAPDNKEVKASLDEWKNS